MSEHVKSAIVTGVVGVGIVIVVRYTMRAAFAGYVKRIAPHRSAPDIAALRTRFTILQRLVVAILLVIVAWSVLENFAATRELARSLLASGAVLTVFVGIALSGPLSNMGAGILLGLTQPVRLGDRISVGDATGTAIEITLYHTILVTDDGRRVYVPNSQLTSSIVTNLSIDAYHKALVVRFPVALHAPVERAREVVLAAAEDLADGKLELKVVLGELTETTAWLVLTATAGDAVDTSELASRLRERGLQALGAEEFLPA